MSAATFSPTSKTEGLEIVPFLKRRIFISPPLMFCFKGCPVTIPCGQCKQLVKASTNNSKNSNNNPNGLFGHEDLLEQLSDHYRHTRHNSKRLCFVFYSTKCEIRCNEKKSGNNSIFNIEPFNSLSSKFKGEMKKK